MDDEQEDRQAFEAYMVSFIEVKASPVPGQNLHLMFISPDHKVLFSCYLELAACSKLAAACEAAVAGALDE